MFIAKRGRGVEGMKKKILAGILVVIMTMTLAPQSLLEGMGIKTEAQAAVNLQNPRVVSDSSMSSGYKVTYDCVYFGSYPQTEIVGDARACGTYGKAWGKDTDYEVNENLYNALKELGIWENDEATYRGIRYRRMLQHQAKYSTTGSASYYDWDPSSSYHYFRYDKIKWRVLNVSGSQAILLSDLALDDQSYYSEESAINWASSTVRSWLNDSFINTAFTSAEKNVIKTVSLNNSTTSPYAGGTNTSDKIYLLSSYDLYTSSAVSYGFSTSRDVTDEARRCKSTTYAKAMGVYSDNTSYTGNCTWWLRSPGNTAKKAARVFNDGNVSADGASVFSNIDGIRPALRINLSSDVCSYAGTVCSDSTVTKGYSVNYDANGGSGAPESQNKTEGIDLELSSTVPTRSGYTFVGWGTSPYATSPTFYAGGKYSWERDATLYAIWSKTITLTYNANGGSGAPSSQSVTIYNSTGNPGFTISTVIPYKSGYEFLGWSTSSSATSGTYQGGDTITLSAGKTLYAIWKKTITLSYDANGGNGAPSVQTGTVYNSTTNYSFSISNDIPSKEGYSFLGWSTSSNASQASHSGGGTISLSTDTVLYAVWKEEQPIYLVTYHANGGSGAPASQEKTAGINLTISNETPTRSGYTFEGWGTAASSVTVSYDPGSTYSLDGDITLYAIWKKAIMLTYDSNGGKEKQTSTTIYVYNSTVSKTIDIGDYVPTREGYDFLGWSTSPDATAEDYHSGDPITISSDTTLYAVWESTAVTTYIVTYNANGGSGEPLDQTKIKGTELILSTVEPTRSGYTFVGWGSSGFSTTVSYDSGSSYDKDANITLYAIWRKGITLTYDANGGSGEPGSQSADIFNNETSYTFTLSNLPPERTGYTFIGWGISSDSTSTYGGGEQISLGEDTTLYAIWSEKQAGDQKVTLFYSDANGGENIPASRTVKKDTTVNLSGLVPMKEDYDFLGWSRDRNARSANYAPGDTVDLTSDLTLYAIWRKTIILSYDGNGGTKVPDSQSSTVYNNDISSTFLIDSKVPERTGYTFLGWNSNRSASSANYAPGDEIDLSSRTTFYAIWKKNSVEGEDADPTDPVPVSKKSQTITAAGKTVAIKSSPFKINAQSSGKGKLSYRSSDTKIATVTSGGIVTVKNYGMVTITITASETAYYKKAQKKVSVTIVPKKMKLKSVKSPKKGQLQAKWVKDKTASGYQIQISRDWRFNKSRSKVFQKSISAKYATLKKPASGLTSKKKYYVRIRAYKKVAGKALYGIWSYGRFVKIK